MKEEFDFESIKNKAIFIPSISLLKSSISFLKSPMSLSLLHKKHRCGFQLETAPMFFIINSP